MGKLIEVDEDAYNRSLRLQEVVGKIVADPKRKAMLEKLHKEVDPTVATPTLDAEAKVMEPIEALRKELADEKKSRAEADAKRESDAQMAALTAKFEAGRARLRSQKFTPAGIEAVEKIMEEQGITDHDIAAAYFEKQNPPQAPAMPGGTGAWNFLEMPTDTDADLKRLVETKGESNVLLDKMAQSALAEIRGVRR